MYVITVARTGPTASIRAPNRMKAVAVQTMARTTTATSTLDDGVVVGHWVTPIGRKTMATRVSEMAMIPTVGRPWSRRARIAGPSA